MVKPILLAATVACLCACAAPNEDAHIYPGLFGQRVVGNASYVSVSNVWNEMDALPLADQHCAKYGKEGARAIFDCVQP